MKSKKSPSKKVANWFKSHTTNRAASDILEEVENWRIETSNLTFLVGTAYVNDWGPNGSNAKPENLKSEAIIEPFSMIFNVGMETIDLPLPRTCIDGVLPALTVVVCFAHFQKILGVISAWALVLRQIKSENNKSSISVDDGLQIIEEDEMYESGALPTARKNLDPLGQLAAKASTILGVDEAKEMKSTSRISTVQHDVFQYIHASIALRRLSAKLFTGTLKDADRLEAHLVSVVLTTSMSTDGSSSSRICGGWFWILDLLPASFPRRQRLIAHSSLPILQRTYLSNDKYNIMEELDHQGVFQDGYEGSSELADIIIRISPSSLQVDDVKGQEPVKDIYVHAKFSSLFINVNPHVIRSLMSTKQHMLESALSSIKNNSEAFSVLLSTLHLSEKPNTVSPRKSSIGNKSIHSRMRLDARMDKLVISFNSAKDDLQLYILTMSGAKIEVSIWPNGESLTAFVEVGDFRMETPPIGRTLPLYRSFMGLAPDQSTCLLSVKFFQGITAVESSGVAGADPAIHESCAQVFLSPMRFVFIQAQILTLVDYIQDGVIGAFLGTTIAASALAAVPEMTQAITGEKLFRIHATSFEFLVPHAAYIQDYFSFHALKLDVKYRSLANFGGGEVDVVLSEMSCACSRGISMLKEPVKIALHAWIAPNHAPTEEDRAIRISMDLSEACLYLTYNQFEQLLYMTKRNMTEEDNFLRDQQPIGSRGIEVDGSNDNLNRHSKTSGNVWDFSTLNHAGVQAMIIKKRILLTTKIQVLALVLCRHSADEPLLEISGVQSDIKVALLPDQSKIQLGMILHNLSVEDRRTETQHRYYRQVFTHIKIREGTKDVFNLQYLKDELNGSTNIDVCIGDLQLVVLPDCMYEVLEFMKIPDIVNMDIERSIVEKRGVDTITNVAIDVNDLNEEIEAMVEKRPIDPKSLQSKVSVKTSTCRIVMVNMEGPESSMCSGKPASMETIVVQGKVDIQINSRKVLLSGIVLSNETQVSCRTYSFQTLGSFNKFMLLNPYTIKSLVKFRLTGSLLKSTQRIVKALAALFKLWSRLDSLLLYRNPFRLRMVLKIWSSKLLLFHL